MYLFRISGLETRVALLIVTPNNLHVLDGFQVQGEGTKRRITWTEIVNQRPLSLDSRRRVQQVEPPSRKLPLRKKSFTGAKLDWRAGTEEENSWLSDIWYQMLHADFGYHRMPLDQVIIILINQSSLIFLSLGLLNFQEAT